MVETRILEHLAGIQEQMAAQRAWQDAQTRNVERFWSQDWPRVVTNIERLADRIDKIEHEVAIVSESRTKVTDHETRLRELEKASVRMVAHAGIIAAIIGIAAPLLARIFVR